MYVNMFSELTILLRDVGRNNLDRRGSIERGGNGGVVCVCGDVGRSFSF
jgi:hypothetical protein